MFIHIEKNQLKKKLLILDKGSKYNYIILFS